MHISLALATYNEESNISECLESCKGLVDEMVVVDGSSTDKTGEIALKAGARVIRTQNVSMFHINKQKAIDACTGDWILQLDADERVTSELAEEIKRVLLMSEEMRTKYQDSLSEKKLFERHQTIVQQNWQKKSGDCNAFFIPRLNYFLGGYLRSGGVYPDGVIRLIKKGKAHLPCKDVHELMEVEGKTGWLSHPLIHKDSPTFKRYLERNSRYIDRMVIDMKRDKIHKNIFSLIDWVLIKPFNWFFMTLIRHKGILDGWRGIVFSFFSAIRFARAYIRYTSPSNHS
ncbi:MAG: glycosyltransferase family 2 protein [Candidatus Roizmanbacteria bacterium]|nr:glycosyltransferase family 2 protein [Candidatus Roizmanbacteria bacterium]